MNIDWRRNALASFAATLCRLAIAGCEWGKQPPTAAIKAPASVADAIADDSATSDDAVTTERAPAANDAPPVQPAAAAAAAQGKKIAPAQPKTPIFVGWPK